MSLKQRLTDDMKAAMKGGDKASLGVIRLVQAAVKQREVDERVELDDAQVLAAMDKMVKQRKDSVTQFEAASREDLAAIERAEIEVSSATAEKMGEAEVQAAIEAACRDRRRRSRRHGQGHGVLSRSSPARPTWARSRPCSRRARPRSQAPTL